MASTRSFVVFVDRTLVFNLPHLVELLLLVLPSAALRAFCHNREPSQPKGCESASNSQLSLRHRAFLLLGGRKNQRRDLSPSQP